MTVHLQKSPSVTWEEHVAWLKSELRFGAGDYEGRLHLERLRSDIAEIEAALAEEAKHRPTPEQKLERSIKEVVALHERVDPGYRKSLKSGAAAK
jgi:hypothetical protein